MSDRETDRRKHTDRQKDRQPGQYTDGEIDGFKKTGLLAGLLVFFDRLVVVFALEEHVSGVLDLCCHGQDLVEVLLDEMFKKKNVFFSVADDEAK